MRKSRKVRLAEEERTAGRKGWWTSKEQQEGKMGG